MKVCFRSFLYFLAPLDPAFFNSLFAYRIWRLWILILLRFRDVYRAAWILLISYMLKRIEIDVISKIVRPISKVVEEIGEVLSSISITYNL
jgi:hypothetical protein